MTWAVHSEPDWHGMPLADLSDEQKVAVVVDRLDSIRVESHGGYESDYVIDAGRVIWADLDPAKDYNRVQLTISPISEFLEEHSWVLEEWDE